MRESEGRQRQGEREQSIRRNREEMKTGREERERMRGDRRRKESKEKGTEIVFSAYSCYAEKHGGGKKKKTRFW